MLPFHYFELIMNMFHLQIKYGRIFARYLSDPSNVFVISSDFCHWGQRFRYQHYDEKCGEIWESIKGSLGHYCRTNYHQLIK